MTAFFAYLTLVLPPGAVPVGGIVKCSGIVPSGGGGKLRGIFLLCASSDAVVPPVSVGCLSVSVLWVVSVAAVVFVVPLVVTVVRAVVVLAVVAAVVPVVFLFLPQENSATESANIANIAKIFFMVISLNEFYKVAKIEMHSYFVHTRGYFALFARVIFGKTKKLSHMLDNA